MLTPRSLFRVFALSEGVTWTLLLAGLLANALTELPSGVITVVGGLHGAVFLGYAVISALLGVNQRWGLGRTVLAVVLAVIPYTTIPFEKQVERKGLLVGEWRREHSGDARDDHWFDRLYRWFILRPLLLTVALLLVVVGIFALLLFVGPPGGWPAAD